MRRTAWALALVLGASGCAAPPPEAYTPDADVKGASAALDIGANTAKEACTLQPDQGGGRIYCGTGVIAAGRVLRQAQAADPVQFLSDSVWRSAFDRRFQCGAPAPATVLDSPAATLSCVRRQGGFAQAVVAVRLDGTLYVADAVGPAAGVIPRAIGVAAGKLPATPAAETAQASDVNTKRAAERALDAGADAGGVAAIAQVRSLMDRGARENRQGNYAAAEAAYRAAVTLQQRVIGSGAGSAAAQTALAVPTARLALQISNQGRYAESDPLFAEADRLAASPDQLDPVAAPQVAYLEALDRINRNRPAEALALLDKAERGFAANVPPDALTPRPSRARTGVERLAEGVTDAALAQDTINAEALFGLIEARRYRAVALRALGRTEEANAVLASARQLYEGRQEAGLVARYYRSVGMAAAATGRAADAASDLGLAVDKFAAAAPGSLPLAKTELLRAAELNRGGNARTALALCRDAAATLQTLKAGADAALVVPCLDVLAAEAASHADEADALHIEMFAMAQRAQGSITSRQIALATARLEQGARDPRVAEAIRRRDTTTDRLDTLYRRRAELAAEKDQRAALGELDDQIRKARDEQKDADQALQAAAPGFAALVQETVSAQDAWAQLGAHEALLAVVMDADDGWVFLLRKGRMAVGKIAGGAARIDPLVARFRASVTPGADNAPPPFDADAAQQIYAAVVGPVADALANADAITVAPAGTLLSVPFAALLTGPAPAGDLAHAPFLIRRFAVAHVPSVASFVNLRKAAQTAQAPKPWFGMGGFHPPTLQQASVSFPPETCGQSARELAEASLLPGAQRELEVARKLLGGEGNDELFGPAFTAKAVQTANLKDFRVLHFATHAVLPGELRCQAEPAILTSTPPGAKDASGGLLTASQVAQMSLNAELVILAACNTGGAGGSTVAGAGESLSGLARSFFFAGARSLLVTHWDANDAYTTYLTALFLAGLRDNPAAGPAMALASAQRRMLDEAQGAQAAQAHPFYWAVLALIGGRGAAGADRMAAAPRTRL
ncbi:MAG: CHAT domain-containing protein [Proteobacteria bacterium]|nr:CHAT domain-containing protein [Pseudomonadota bacterium]